MSNKKIKYICKYCGKEYYSYKDKSNYCSRECRNKDNQYIYYCEYCGKEMLIPKWKYDGINNGDIKHLYCSKECSDKAHTKKTTKICEQCGKEFLVSNCFKDIQRFCSRECYEESRKKKFVCPVCGKEFEPTTDCQIYCSDECKQSVGVGSSIVLCDYCGKPITRNNYEIYSHNKHYCSKECMALDLYWNVDDLNILEEYFGKISNFEIQKKLSKERSLSEITRKAHQIGISTDTSWSDSEIAVIKENYSNTPLAEIENMLPGRTTTSIIAKASSLGVISYFTKNHFYSSDEIEYIYNNYKSMTDNEIANHLGRSEIGITRKLSALGLVRPTEIKKDGYYDLVKFTRSRIWNWRMGVIKSYNYTCSLTGKTNDLVVHHIRSFNLLFEETVESLDFPLYEDFTKYTDDQLLLFVDKFLDIQEYYHEYTCINESVHKKFHGIYGYGDNTKEQWDDFIEKYKGNYYDEVA